MTSTSVCEQVNSALARIATNLAYSRGSTSIPLLESAIIHWNQMRNDELRKQVEKAAAAGPSVGAAGGAGASSATGP